MSRPRASIAEIMAAVAVLALDCGAIHQILATETANQPSSHWRIFAEIDLLGGLPMANLLGLVAWRARRRQGPASRGFLIAGGSLTLAFVVAAAVAPLIIVYPVNLLIHWIDSVYYPSRALPLLAVLAAASTALTLPMLLPALAAAWFQGRYQLRIERRPPIAAGRAPQPA